ncbi:hypothetical protein BV22DRAFT_268848 [Leucogyrophana mollusca]|uniref:Uncharacterized protein n=1 Tax=Leucogyrophana mollusca TaxID=85980 RepID=A0ACB8BNY2_9AGAM|nr:hypothetical protein BV22DRAFT_268848 [Leucogyrophana mollusca]
MEAPVGTVSIDISAAFDGLYWAFMLATVLSGISIVQGWIYFNNYDKDHWLFRVFVAILINRMADLTTTGLDLKVLHFCLIENFGDLASLIVITSPVTWEFILTVATVFCVQVFFASRIYLFYKQSVWLPVAIIFFGAGALVSGVLGAGFFFSHNSVPYLATKKNKILFIINGSCAAVADIATTIFLTWTLASAKRGFKRTNTILQKLLVYIVSRGLLVTVTQVLFLVIYLAWPEQLYWVPLHFMASKLYVITMVAMLNGRRFLRELGGDVHVVSASSLLANSVRGDQRIVVRKTVELDHFQDDHDTERSAGKEGTDLAV